MNLLIGAPVLRREWIIGDWFQHVIPSLESVVDSVGILIVADPRDPTVGMLHALCKKKDIPLYMHDIVDNVENPHNHRWGDKSNIRHMVELRNLLLRQVRKLEPDLFLSLDTDILVTGAAVPNMIDTLINDERRFNAVGGRCYMGSGRAAPSWYNSIAKGTRRDGLGIFPVDVIMAIKLMDADAYSIDYEYHEHGEDVGWSKRCLAEGLNLGVDAREICKHVLRPELLYKFDKRCGF